MVAQLLRIRTAVLANNFRQQRSRVASLIVAVLLAAAAVAVLCVGLVMLRDAPDQAARNIIIFGGSFVLLAFAVVPILFGIPADLDPRTLALFGFSDRQVAIGSVVAFAVSVPVIALAVVAAFTVATWWEHAGAVVAAVLCVLLGVKTAVLVSRVMGALASLFLGSLRSRGFTAIVLGLLIVLIAPAVILFASVDVTADGFAAITSAANVMSWTPFGAVWAVPGDIALGAVGAAVLKLLIALATVVLLWVAWEKLVSRLLVTPGRHIASETSGGLGWFDALPAIPAAVIGARSLTYWGRDSRYLVPIIVIPLVPFFMVLALAIAGVPLQPLSLLPVPVMALFLGWSLHNDLAFDSSAIWLHVTAGARGTADRLGRMLPVVLIGIPLVVIGTMISVMIFSDWTVLPAVLGVNTALFLGGVGLSSYASARYPYPAVQPGDSPFQQPQTSGSGSVFAQAFTLIGALVTAAPAIYFAVLGFTESASWFVASLYAGVILGFLVAVLGVVLGGRAFDRRAPEIMAFATSTS